jgi:stage V sporulation protein AC
MTEKQYAQLVQQYSPNSPIAKNCLLAFLFGGAICTLGQVLTNVYESFGLPQQEVSCWVSVTLVGISVLLTGFSLYDDIAKYAGAGTLVPITGFANSMSAPAIEFRTEGFILGVGAKMFTIAGPVIVYGVSASVVYGVIYWITTLF